MKKLLLTSVAALTLAVGMTQSAFAATFKLDAQGPNGDAITSEFEGEAQQAEMFFKELVNKNNLGDLVWSYDAETGLFTARPQEETTTTVKETTSPVEEVTKYTYKLIVETADTKISTEYEAEDIFEAEAYFQDYVADNGLGELTWTFDRDTLTFKATDVEAPEVETVVYKLDLKTKDTTITSEYEASSVEEAEKYFRDYVAKNGLGELVWKYDEKTKTFVVTDIETTTTTNETTKENKPAENKPAENKPAEKGNAKAELPQTGEASIFAVYGAAALSVLAGLGLVSKKRKDA